MTTHDQGKHGADESALEPETVKDLEPDSDEADVVRGGKTACLGTHGDIAPRCGGGTHGV